MNRSRDIDRERPISRSSLSNFPSYSIMAKTLQPKLLCQSYSKYFLFKSHPSFPVVQCRNTGQRKTSITRVVQNQGRKPWTFIPNFVQVDPPRVQQIVSPDSSDYTVLPRFSSSAILFSINLFNDGVLGLRNQYKDSSLVVLP